MHRRSIPCLLALAAVGCGGTGQQQTSVMAPNDPSMRSGGNASGVKVDPIFKPATGVNSPLGTLKTISEKSPLAKAVDGKVPVDSATKLAKLDKEGLKLDDAYNYIVAGADAPRATTAGEKGLSVPLPVDAKPNPDGSVWVVDAEMRRVFTLTGVKREADKPPVVAEATTGDLVHPTPDAAVPALGLVARADEATGEIKHALRILVKGVGAEGAPATGTVIRLKKSVAEKGLPPLTKSLVRAMKKYGAVLEVGEGGPSLPAIVDPRWSKEDTKAIAALHMTDFEVVTPPAKPGNSSKNKA